MQRLEQSGRRSIEEMDDRESSMKLGVMIEGQEGLTWARWTRLIDAADGLGFDSIWRSDHLYSVMGRYERKTLSLWPSLTAVGIRSDRLEFGQLVSPVSFRNPVHLAFDAASLDHLSHGRFWLGVGAGWNESEHAGFGFSLLSLKERMDRFEEALEVITRLWSGERVYYEGEHYTLNGGQASYTPVKDNKVRIVIGGSGEKRTIPLAARYADEWNVTPMSQEDYNRKIEVFEQACSDANRDPADIQLSIMLTHLIGRDQDELRARAKKLQEITGRPGTPDEILDGMRERGLIVGTPDEVVEQIKRREAQGISRIQLQTLDMDDIDVLELIASDVMPQL